MKNLSITLLGLLIIPLCIISQQAESADPSRTVITIVNVSNHTLCNVFISPSADQTWTGESLNKSVMKHWAKRYFTVPTGVYDFQARDCDGNVIKTEFNLFADEQSRLAWGVNDPSIPPVYFPDITPLNAEIVRDTTAADADWDLVPDTADKCPLQKETHNGIFDHDGCPDAIEDLVNFYKWDVSQFWAQEAVRQSRQQYGTSYFMPAVEFGWRNDYAAHYAMQAQTTRISNLFQTEVVKKFGDHAAGFIIAHEWAHAVQDSKGILTYDVAPTIIEQHADCLAGAYSRSAHNRAIITDADIAEVHALLARIGDGAAIDHAYQTHGSSKNRIIAYSLGYDRGIDACQTILF